MTRPHQQADAVNVCRSHDPDQGSEYGADDGPVLGAFRSGPLLLVALPDACWEQGELLPLWTLCVLIRCPEATLLLRSGESTSGSFWIKFSQLMCCSIGRYIIEQVSLTGLISTIMNTFAYNLLLLTWHFLRSLKGRLSALVRLSNWRLQHVQVFLYIFNVIFMHMQVLMSLFFNRINLGRINYSCQILHFLHWPDASGPISWRGHQEFSQQSRWLPDWACG